MSAERLEDQLAVVRQRLAVLSERAALGVAPAALVNDSLQAAISAMDQITLRLAAQQTTMNTAAIPESLLAVSAHQMEEALVITDAQLDFPGPRFVYVNQGFTRLTGYTAEDVIGKTPRILQGPATDRAEIKRLRHDLDSQQYFHGETVNYRKDGSQFIIDWYIKPVRDAAGTITHWMAVQHDVTARKRTEAALQRAQQANTQLAAAVNTLTSGVVITDPLQHDNPIIYANPGFCVMTGYDRDEVLGRNCRFLQGPNTDPAMVTRLRAAIAEQRTITVEMLNYTRTGEPFWNELTVDPVFDADGTIVNFIGLQNDITARKQAEADYAHLLAETQQAVQARDSFLTIAAHELKTPTTSMRAYAQLLQRRLAKDQQVDAERLQQGLAVIDRQSDKLARLTDQLLDVARLESGRLILERRETALVPLIEDIVTGVQTTTHDHTLRMQADQPVMALVDPLRFEQVITNLLTNAVKYSPDGGDIVVGITTAPDGQHSISVTDHGTGIPPHHRSHIFDRFYRAHNDSYTSGMGIGLYISKQIMVLHGGTIDVVFPEAGGTQFIVRLPAQPKEAAPDSIGGEANVLPMQSR